MVLRCRYVSGALEERAPNDLQAIKLQDEWNKCNHLSQFCLRYETNNGQELSPSIANRPFLSDRASVSKRGEIILMTCSAYTFIFM